MTAFEFLQNIWHQTPGPVKTFIVAAVGVLFGAWITSRSQTKKAIVAELHALRFAQALCFSIANKALAIKRQHVKPMVEAFEASIRSWEEVAASRGKFLHLQLELFRRQAFQLMFWKK